MWCFRANYFHSHFKSRMSATGNNYFSRFRGQLRRKKHYILTFLWVFKTIQSFPTRNRNNILNSSLVVSQGLRWLVFHNGGARHSLMPVFTKFRIVLCLITKKIKQSIEKSAEEKHQTEGMIILLSVSFIFLFKEKRSVNHFHFPGLKCRTADSHGNTVISMNPFF